MGEPSTKNSGEGTKRPAEPAKVAIEDHALIGDLRTAALVTRGGSIDWLCLPDFDSDACFVSLLGTNEHGHWTIAPTATVLDVQHRYRGQTLILETVFSTDAGVLKLTDFMPPRQANPHIVRMVECLSGEVPFRSDLSPRFAFGRARPSMRKIGDATMLFAGPDAVYLRGGGKKGSAPPPTSDHRLKAGERITFALTWGRAYEGVAAGVDPVEAERTTEAYWKDWCAKIRPPARYADEVIRSLIVLKACTFSPTGGIVAAPTTSLPETPGGVRNWDYRFCWLRDASLTINAFACAGLEEEAKQFRDWVFRAIAGDPAEMQIMYGIRGERRLTEAELDWLPGYGGAKPVRVGNAAYEQFQLDVLGEVGRVIFRLGNLAGKLVPEVENALFAIAEHATTAWKRPDRGIWEMRGPERSFTSSKVAAWAVIDGAIRWAEDRGLERPLDRLREARSAIFEEVCRDGYDAKSNTFTQYYGGKGVDASLLAIALSGFLPIDDPRVIGTVEAIERELMPDGLVLRFRPEGDVDGLSGQEGVFLACSFWLADTYTLMGRRDDAVKIFERVLACSNDLGLLAEEYDPVHGCQLGNFPQAFSHFSLVNCAYLLSQTEEKRAAA